MPAPEVPTALRLPLLLRATAVRDRAPLRPERGPAAAPALAGAAGTGLPAA